jgi:hypothetical protein
MIRLDKLIPSQSLRRYDDDGEPLYTAAERILIAMRHHDHDWVYVADLYAGMDMPGRESEGRNACDQAMSRLAGEGRIERRTLPGDAQQVRLALVQPVIIHKPAPVEEDKPAPVDAIGRQRARKAAKVRARRQSRRERGVCMSCDLATEPGRSTCPSHTEARRLERERSRREYWRDHKRDQRGATQVHRCSGCGEIGHRVTTCAVQRRAA